LGRNDSFSVKLEALVGGQICKKGRNKENVRQGSQKKREKKRGEEVSK